MPSSRLFYCNTDTEVSLGDRVLIKRWFRRPLPCVVTYLPGISKQNTKLEYDGVRQWAVTGDNGSTYAILYDPDSFQPPRHIVFVSRGAPVTPPAYGDLN